MLVNLNCYAKCRADTLLVCVLVRSKGFEGNHTLFTANGSQGSRRDQCFARVVESVTRPSGRLSAQPRVCLQWFELRCDKWIWIINDSEMETLRQCNHRLRINNLFREPQYTLLVIIKWWVFTAVVFLLEECTCPFVTGDY